LISHNYTAPKVATLRLLVDAYILTHDLQRSTEHYYRTAVGVFVRWHRRDQRTRIIRDVPMKDFTPDRVSEFLHQKQQDGASSYYLKSLRNALRALLYFAGKTGRVRSVKLHSLAFDIWDAEDVSKLVAAVDATIKNGQHTPHAEARRKFWREIITAAWYTGLSSNDLHLLSRVNVATDGRMLAERHKTGKRVLSWLPPELTKSIRESAQPPWALQTSREFFRLEFRRITKAAGLKGTFKKLRKSSGTNVEIHFPGKGHEHLANTRQVFEQHYLSVDALPAKPFKPSRLPTLGSKRPRARKAVQA
jgi:hypothetical protein